jgi:hypothetical protein
VITFVGAGGLVATQVFSDEELERLRGFPEIGREELIRFFTLTSADVAFVDPGRGRGPADRLGLALQLCTLPWLGFVPDEVRVAPPAAGIPVVIAVKTTKMQVSDRVRPPCPGRSSEAVTR